MLPKFSYPTSTRMAREARIPSLTMQMNLKQLKTWFCMWHEWQKRIVICRIIESCSEPHLKLLATSLEPVLHLDFSTALSPLMAALHHEGSQTFRIQRAAGTSNIKPAATSEIAPMKSELSSKNIWSTEQHRKLLPLHSSTTVGNVQSDSVKDHKQYTQTHRQYDQQEQIFLPIIPRTHSKHKVSPASSDFSNPQTSLYYSSDFELSPLHRTYNSVPDIRSSTDLIKITSQRNAKIKKRQSHHHFRTRSLMTGVKNTTLVSLKKHRQLEVYNAQLACISKVCLYLCKVLLYNIIYNHLHLLYLLQWMYDCGVGDITNLLLEIIKMSDRHLLGYIVQCLYQRCYKSGCLLLVLIL